MSATSSQLADVLIAGGSVLGIAAAFAVIRLAFRRGKDLEEA